VTTGPVTTDEILDAAEKRTGLTRPQLLVLVAKSATVRHLASCSVELSRESGGNAINTEPALVCATVTSGPSSASFVSAITPDRRL
jgi:hypothetical protein